MILSFFTGQQYFQNFRELLYSTQKGWLNFYCYANVTDEIGNTLQCLALTCDNSNIARTCYAVVFQHFRHNTYFLLQG